VLEMLSLSKVEGNKERREKRNKTEEILSRWSRMGGRERCMCVRRGWIENGCAWKAGCREGSRGTRLLRRLSRRHLRSFRPFKFPISWEEFLSHINTSLRGIPVRRCAVRDAVDDATSSPRCINSGHSLAQHVKVTRRLCSNRKLIVTGKVQTVLKHEANRKG
jgi:hypothetical protein